MKRQDIHKMQTKVITLILLISIGINIVETSAGNGFYKGYMIKSIMNKAGKRNRKMTDVKKICQTKILNISSDTTIVKESCMKQKIYLTKTQKLLNTMFALFVITFGIIGCFNMNARDREELFDMWMGMIAADVVDSLFDDD